MLRQLAVKPKYLSNQDMTPSLYSDLWEETTQVTANTTVILWLYVLLRSTFRYLTLGWQNESQQLVSVPDVHWTFPSHHTYSAKFKFKLFPSKPGIPGNAFFSFLYIRQLESSTPEPKKFKFWKFHVCLCLWIYLPLYITKSFLLPYQYNT